MRIWRLDGVESTDIPKGILIARNGKATPSAPPNYPHKVEYLDTARPTVEWIVVCDNERDPVRELAEALHGKLCRLHHDDGGCGWGWDSWDKPGNDRQRYEAKAREMWDTITVRLPDLSLDGRLDFGLSIIRMLP